MIWLIRQKSLKIAYICKYNRQGRFLYLYGFSSVLTFFNLHRYATQRKLSRKNLDQH